MQEYQNIKIFLQKVTFHIGSEKVFAIKKVKNTVPWTYVVSHLNEEQVASTFYKKELLKAYQKEFRVEEVIERKSDKLYITWNGNDSWINNINDNINQWIFSRTKLLRRKSES